MVECAIAKLILCPSIQVGWKTRAVDFENAFINVWLDKSVYVGLQNKAFLETRQRVHGMKLRQGVYSLRDIFTVQNK